jgi:NAD(P)-dependent dehydrogenase (short-subunit alcohol dehydrogenase family)
MAVNATGVFFGIKYAILAMVANGGGSIVNLSSIAGIIGSEHVHMAYNGIVNLSRGGIPLPWVARRTGAEKSLARL